MAMPPYGEVAHEWVQTAQVQAWLARVLEDLGGEHPVPALPSCGLCDALVLVLLESLQNLDTALCKNCLLYTSPSPRDVEESRMPSSA